ncbi:TerD family protein [Desulfobacter latus]|uniref:TerD family protein n=2 Tax=Desulfobacter latus TaxID=2292 RepID=A0A850TBQ2_9BACT|nr:TerD family protein [Desulfobacter latus]
MVPGQRCKLHDLPLGHLFDVEISLSFTESILVDISCFGVDAQNQLSDDRYMIFYNQKRSPCGALAIVKDDVSNSHTFQVNLDQLPETVQKLVFTATIDGAGTMKALKTGALTLRDHTGSGAEFKFNSASLNQEKALIIAEVYLKNQWRLAAVAQGFNEGLGALLRHFGGEEETAPQATSTPPPPPSLPEKKVSLSKITLEKKGDKKSISLEKSAKNTIHVNLNWDAPQSKKLSFFGSDAAPDLDLGCMFRLKDGNAGVIQPLGNNFGSQHQLPYILLDQDDRSGSSAAGENLTIYKPELIDVIMIFAFIYKGAKDFTTVNGRVTVRDHKGNEIYIKLDSPDPRHAFCATCSFTNTGESLDLRKEELYFPGHQDADKHFGFGFRWKRGIK